MQIKLVPAEAPYLKSAELLIAADCTAFACPDFHDSFLRSRVCLVGCPKLDGTEFYTEKLAQIIRLNKVASIDVVYMEVPCCGGLAKLAEKAVVSSGEPVTLNLSVLSLEGRVLETRVLHG